MQNHNPVTNRFPRHLARLYSPMAVLQLVLWLSLGITGCATNREHRNLKDDVVLEKASVEVPEAQLLDVWIQVFDPGSLPEDEDDGRGLTMSIREAEARYMPIHLRDVMEKTGYWGAVRVMPGPAEGSEVDVSGLILDSDGIDLELEITATDASGREWFKNTYSLELDPERYTSYNPGDIEIFESVYDAIANDLARFRLTLTAKDIGEIRSIAEMRFAADMAPDAFAAYLDKDEDGHYKLVRLPATDDQMYRRVRTIRQRDFLLVDTLNGHFDNFNGEMHSPYLEWRKARTIEDQARRKAEHDATMRKALGVAAIVGAIAIEALGGNSTRRSTASLRNMMVLGGAYVVKTGFDMDSQSGIHRDAIEELGESFSTEAEPIVIELDGETHELTGSARAQYAEWRGLLKKLYFSETGFPPAASPDSPADKPARSDDP